MNNQLEPALIKPYKRKNTGWIAGLIIIITIITLVIFNWDWLHARFTYISKPGFKSGDKLYATPDLFDDKAKMTSMLVLRLVRPMNETDIDLMNISPEKKEALKKQVKMH